MSAHLHSPSTSHASNYQVATSFKDKTVRRVYTVIEWLWYRMAFLKRKRVKFSVDLQVCHLSDVPLVNAVLFAKVRLLEGGNFEGVTERVDVVSHAAKWDRRFTFTCRIGSDPATGILERCPCRISIRKEQKGGRSYQKLGYVDINLSEFAASGIEGLSRSYLLDGYGTNARQDNSKVAVKVTMCHQSADPFFKVPRIASLGEDLTLNPEERRAPMGNSEEDEMDSIGGGANGEAVAYRNHAADIGESSAGSSSLAGEDSASLASETRRTGGIPAVAPSNNTLRRLSQDRSSAPRVQSTRIDNDGVIDDVLRGVREEYDVEGDGENHEGLALYVGRDGEAIIAPPPGMHTRLFERVHIDSSNHI